MQTSNSEELNTIPDNTITKSKDAKEEETQSSQNEEPAIHNETTIKSTYFSEEDHVNLPKDDERSRSTILTSTTTIPQQPSLQMEENLSSPSSDHPISLNNNFASTFNECEREGRSSPNVLPIEPNISPFDNNDLVLQLSPEHLSSNGSNGSSGNGSHDNNTTHPHEELTTGSEEYQFNLITTHSEPEQLARTEFKQPDEKEELFVIQRNMLSQLGILEDANYLSMESFTLQDVPTRVPNSPDLLVAPRFVLYQQPDPTQRRSYAKEKRYVTPKPLVVCSKEVLAEHVKEKLPKITSGSVTVELAVAEGVNTENSVKYMPNLLECTDGKTKPLDDRNIAEFELTILGNSGPNKFLLVFTVSYSTELEESFVEQIVSQPFSVHANVPKMKKTEERAPTVRALQPKEGPADSETEVWIKGSEFNSLVNVTFAHNPAKILSIENNLLTVVAPKLPDIQQDTSVPVSVSNIYPNTSHAAVHKPRYTYFTGDPLRHIRSQASNNNPTLNESNFNNNNNTSSDSFK